MEHWVIPLLSAFIVVEWAAIWWRRRRRRSSPDRVAGLDMLVTFVAFILLISSFQYVSADLGELARIAVNVLRITLFGTGLYVLYVQRYDAPDS